MRTKNLKQKFTVTFDDVDSDMAIDLENKGLSLGIKPTINPRMPPFIPPVPVVKKSTTAKKKTAAAPKKKIVKKTGK
ncbi:MAG TPA: hypothetical protein PKW80_10295 [Bacteroidales bacterium]|nr:hypothetical protein [Bacteroidales bacterium]